jgi:hypothetical protein
MGLMLAFALSREEAEHMLRVHNVDVARKTWRSINELPEPKVWAKPLRWWRRGKDAALSVVCSDILSTSIADHEFSEKGHKRR